MPVGEPPQLVEGDPLQLDHVGQHVLGAEQVDRPRRGRARGRKPRPRAAGGDVVEPHGPLRPQDGADRHHPATHRLPEADEIGPHVPVLDGEHPTGPSEPRLHLVGAQEPAVLVAEVRERGPERVGRHQHAARADDRLDDDAGHLGGVHRVKQQVVADVVDRGVAAAARPWRPERGSVGVRVGGVGEAGSERPQSAADVALLRPERRRRRGLAVVLREEADDHRAARRAAHHLDRGLDGLRAVQRQIDPRQPVRRDGEQLLGELDHRFAGERVAVLVAVPAERFDGRLDDVLTTGAERDRRRRRDEVEVDVAVDVLDRVAVLACDDEGREAVPGPWIEEAGRTLEELTAARPWRRDDDAWCGHRIAARSGVVATA